MARDINDAQRLGRFSAILGFGYFGIARGLSKAGCGKVGSTHGHFDDEMKVMRLLMGTGSVYEIR